MRKFQMLVLGLLITGFFGLFAMQNVAADEGDEIAATEGTENVTALPDHAESLGRLVVPVDPGNLPTTIFGSDNRKIVSNTTKAPYRKIVAIISHFSGQPKNISELGTGELIGPNVVLTAAHCIIQKENGNARPQWIRVYEGVKPTKKGGYSAKLVASGSSSSYVAAYRAAGIRSEKRYDNDIGIIRLNKNIGSKVGTFGCTSSVKTGQRVTLTGFSADKYPNMTTAAGKVTKLTSNIESYQIDMLPGASGSGLLDSAQRITAVNTYENSSENFGTRINQLKLDYIHFWLGKSKGHKFGKNIRISKSDTLWGNHTCTKVKLLRPKIGTKYMARYIFNNPNGSSYLSLYDSNGVWAGYINKMGTKV